MHLPVSWWVSALQVERPPNPEETPVKEAFAQGLIPD